jgi:hypothetical protein
MAGIAEVNTVDLKRRGEAVTRNRKAALPRFK